MSTPHEEHSRGSGGATRLLRVSLLTLAAAALVVWTVFPFFWILLTSLKQPLDVIAAPPKLMFEPTLDNYVGIFIGQIGRAHV